MFSKKSKAFTITELVIVIAVVAILAAVLIPTFSNVVNKANMSADEQAVRMFNTALKSDEALNGVPVNPKDAMAVLKDAGFSIEGYHAVYSQNTLYWDKSSNLVLIYTQGQGVTYPSELKDKYKDEQSNNLPEFWYEVKDAYKITVLDEGTTFESAVGSLEDGETLQLLKNESVSEYTFTGKSYEIDLNGNTITFENTTGIRAEEEASVVFRNGNISMEGQADLSKSGASIKTNSSITVENVNVTAKNSAFFPNGDAAQVNIINSKVSAGLYCVGTNAATSDNYNVNIKIENSTLVSSNSLGDSLPVMINVPGSLSIRDSVIEGQRQGVMVRAGDAVIENTTIKTTCEYGNIDQYLSSNWSSGNEVPAFALVVGNNNGSYNADANVTLKNVTLAGLATGSAVTNRKCLISANDSYKANLTIVGTDLTVSEIYQQFGGAKVEGHDQITVTVK